MFLSFAVKSIKGRDVKWVGLGEHNWVGYIKLIYPLKFL